jgi:hypothetical protein
MLLGRVLIAFSLGPTGPHHLGQPLGVACRWQFPSRAQTLCTEHALYCASRTTGTLARQRLLLLHPFCWWFCRELPQVLLENKLKRNLNHELPRRPGQQSGDKRGLRVIEGKIPLPDYVSLDRSKSEECGNYPLRFFEAHSSPRQMEIL